MYSMEEIRMILSVAVLYKRRIVKSDTQLAFLQTGRGARDVIVIHPRESEHKNELYFQLAAAYGLMNANDKKRMQSDTTFKSLDLKCRHEAAWLFVQHIAFGALCLIVIKTVGDILSTRIDNAVRKFTPDFENYFTMDSISHSPARLRFYSLVVAQPDNYTC